MVSNVPPRDLQVREALIDVATLQRQHGRHMPRVTRHQGLVQLLHFNILSSFQVGKAGVQSLSALLLPTLDAVQ